MDFLVYGGGDGEQQSFVWDEVGVNDYDFFFCCVQQCEEEVEVVFDFEFGIGWYYLVVEVIGIDVGVCDVDFFEYDICFVVLVVEEDCVDVEYDWFVEVYYEVDLVQIVFDVFFQVVG